MTSLAWTFLGVEGVNVQCPRALDGGVARIIGKRHDGDAYVLADPHVYTLTKREAATLRAFFAKCLKRGELRPADKFTAESFGVPFAPLTAAHAAAGVTDG